MLSVDEQLHIIESGVSNILPREDLKKKLAKGKPLTIKLGVDPTAPDLHLGHAVPLQKMRQFQNLGHNVKLIIGGGTALIGDPSGRDVTRPQITKEEVQANARTYMEQAFKVLDPDKTEVLDNADWILSLNLAGLLELCSNFTVARILERDDFTKRYKNEEPIALHEFLYPVMQAYDSVVIKADLEMGGNDQLFNLLAGRDLMEKKGLEPQVCLTMPLLEGTDGVRKMSKSYKNYVALTDKPEDMFGKIMSIPDEMIARYYRLASNLEVDEVERIEKGLESGELHPNEEKRKLARNIISIYHDDPNAPAQAEEHFNTVFRDKSMPDDIKEVELGLAGEIYLPKLMQDVGFTNTSSEGRRLIDGGGFKIEGEAVEKGVYNLDADKLIGKTLQAGKRRFVQIKN